MDTKETPIYKSWLKYIFNNNTTFWFDFEIEKKNTYTNRGLISNCIITYIFVDLNIFPVMFIITRLVVSE
jgi:hypothetical protein